MKNLSTVFFAVMLAQFTLGCSAPATAQPNAAASSTAPTSAPASPSTVQLTQMDSGKQITLAQGDTFDIVLDQNASTGYSWQLLSLNDRVLRLLSSKPTNVSAIPGAPSKQVYKFQAIGAGLDTVWFGYKQWTNAQVEPETTFVANVIVQGTPVLPTARPTQAGAPKPLEKLTKLTLADSGKMIALAMGDTFQVDFDLDGKSQGEWQIISNGIAANQLVSIGIVYPGGTPAVTVPRQTFTFKAASPISGSLRLGFKDWANETAQLYSVFEVNSSVSMPAVLPKAGTGSGGTVVTILNKQHPSATVNTAQDLIAIMLQGAPGAISTFVSGNDAIIKPQFDPTKPLDVSNGGTVAGYPGYFFKFQPTSPGTATLTFVQKQNGASDTYTVTVNVK